MSQDFSHIIGQSAELKQVLNTAELIARTDVTVLIEGDTGSGKELLARAMHAASPRQHAPFIAVNCAALAEALVESQLFGHRRGAFTGAERHHNGFVQQAEGGTLFLDEIGELPLPIQAKLLRFIEYGECQVLGKSTVEQANVRVIAATNRDLAQCVEQGEFRQDLYYRLNVVPVCLPELSQRKQDIPLLVKHFMTELSQQHQLPCASVSKSALACLQDYHWPGNVRELRNVCESLLVLLQGQKIELDNLPLAIRQPATANHGFTLPASGIRFDELEVDLLKQALQASSGNKSRAARLLGISRDVFLYRLKKYAII